MSRLQLLTSVQGDGPVVGDVGDLVDVAPDVAAIWADGERAVFVDEPTVDLVKRVPLGGRLFGPGGGIEGVPVVLDPAAAALQSPSASPAGPAKRTRQRRAPRG